MRSEAEIVFEVEEPAGVLAALAPEAEDRISRSEVALAACEGGIRLKIESEDVVSLRAALNTWIRLVDIAIKMVKV